MGRLHWGGGTPTILPPLMIRRLSQAMKAVLPPADHFGQQRPRVGAVALREAKVGETVRIYFGVGGPNATSSFHVIGEIFDTVWDLGNTQAFTPDVQTVNLAPGGATIADVRFEVPGTYALVDHALSRVEKGLVGQIRVEGAEDPAIFAAPAPAM